MSHFSYAPLFQGPHFLQKCWNRTFSMIIYLLTFYLFDDIEKISESLMRIILLRQRQFCQRMHLQPERLYFLFALCARHHYPWWSLRRKNTKNYYFNQLKLPFWSLNLVTSLPFEELLVLTATIIKQVFLCKLFWYESLVDIEVSKTEYILPLTGLIAFGSSDVITNINTMTPLNPLFFTKINGGYMVV